MMDELMAIGAGVASGVVCALPALLALAQRGRPGGPSMGRGLAAIIIAFLAITALLFLVRSFWPQALVPFGASCVLSFLFAVTAVALRTRERAR